MTFLLLQAKDAIKAFMKQADAMKESANLSVRYQLANACI